MWEILDVIREEKMEFQKEKLLFVKGNVSLDKLKLTLSAGEVFRDSFMIQIPEDCYTYGYVSSSDVRMECITGKFTGTEEIHFCFYGAHMEKGECCRGEFLIRSNQGEFTLPFEVQVLLF